MNFGFVCDLGEECSAHGVDGMFFTCFPLAMARERGSDEKLNKSVNIYVERCKNKASPKSRVIKVKVEDLLILFSRLF